LALARGGEITKGESLLSVLLVDRRGFFFVGYVIEYIMMKMLEK
jgi:hypothetical protein